MLPSIDDIIMFSINSSDLILFFFIISSMSGIRNANTIMLFIRPDTINDIVINRIINDLYVDALSTTEFIRYSIKSVFKNIFDTP